MRSKPSTLNVSLNPHLEQWIAEQVASGWYNNASEVVRDGLRLLRAQQQEREARIRDLRAAIAEGDASSVTEWEGVEAIKAKARAYHADRTEDLHREKV